MPKQPDCMQHLSTAALLQKQYQACMLVQHTRKDTSSPRHLLLVLEGLFLSLSHARVLSSCTELNSAMCIRSRWWPPFVPATWSKWSKATRRQASTIYPKSYKLGAAAVVDSWEEETLSVGGQLSLLLFVCLFLWWWRIGGLVVNEKMAVSFAPWRLSPIADCTTAVKHGGREHGALRPGQAGSLVLLQGPRCLLEPRDVAQTQRCRREETRDEEWFWVSGHHSKHRLAIILNYLES